MSEIIKILVVDDSAFMRKSITLLLESDKNLKVIGTAVDGFDAISKIKLLNPDIVTLDIEMPRMDGLTALRHIMTECPKPVLMLSSLTTEGAEETIKALELGAIDFIPKSISIGNASIGGVKADLLRKVKEIFNNKLLLRKINLLKKDKVATIPKIKQNSGNLPIKIYKAMGIGISTGGPISLQKIVPLFSDRIRVPIFIVQHMPPKFTTSLAERLNKLSQLEVKEAEKGEVVRNGVVYIAPGGFHMIIKQDGLGNKLIDISEQPAQSLHRPSVDVMLESIQNAYGKNILGIIMTGMGKDGFEGIKKLKNIGGYCLAQDEESCVVYGMPRAVIENGLADAIASLNDIPQIINQVI